MTSFNFSTLIAPFSVHDFFEHYWEKKYLHISRNTDYYLQNVLDTNDIDDFFTQQNISPERLNLAKNGTIVPQADWTDSVRLIDGRIVPFVNTAKVFSQYVKGATIIINAAHKSIPKLAKACGQIEQEFKMELQANIYITPTNSQGFAKHYDIHDIFSMQIKGTKSWKFYDTGEELPIVLAPFTKEPQLIKEFEMNKGDFLYMLRGLVHEASASKESTIHVNFSHKARYGFHLLEDLAKIAEKEDVFFRRTLPHHLCNAEEKQNYIRLFTQKLETLIAAHSVEELINRQEETFIEKQKPLSNGRFTDILKLEQLNINTKVVRRKEIVYSLKKEENGILIIFGKDKLLIPNWLDKEIILNENPFIIRDIIGLATDKIKIDFVKKFVEAGFLTIQEI